MSIDLILLLVSLFTWGLGEGMFIYFQPIYLQQLGANTMTIATVFSFFGLAMMVAHIPAGYLADRIGLIGAWVYTFSEVPSRWYALSIDWAQHDRQKFLQPGDEFGVKTEKRGSYQVFWVAPAMPRQPWSAMAVGKAFHNNANKGGGDQFHL